MLRPPQTPRTITWISKDLAIGAPSDADAWLALRSRGVRAVVDLNSECGGVGDTVRDAGMRYLRLPVDSGGLPEAEELHIVATWVLQRISEGGAALIHDPAGRGNDALVACAVLVKRGGNASKARSQLRSLAQNPLNNSQVTLLQRFVAQHVIAVNGR